MDNENNRDNLPSIETRRLLLRALKMSDTDDIFEYASDPEVSKHTFWDTHKSIEDTQRFISQQISSNSACWGIVHKEDKRVIGTCYLHSFDAKHGRAEIAFYLSRKYWGKGYATEAVRQVILFTFENWELNRIGGTCMSENVASGRVLEKVGMTFEGILRKHSYARDKFHDLVVYSILRDEI